MPGRHARVQLHQPLRLPEPGHLPPRHRQMLLPHGLDGKRGFSPLLRDVSVILVPMFVLLRLEGFLVKYLQKSYIIGLLHATRNVRYFSFFVLNDL